MHIGFVMVGFMDRDWGAALDTVAELGISHIEPCGGGHFPNSHYDPIELVANAASLRRFKESVDGRGLVIDALACHGNPLHPRPDRRQHSRETYDATCELAELLGVSRIDVISGCPSGGPNDTAPNWIVNSLFPDWEKIYKWQWESELLPYWRDAAAKADQHGVTVCMEPHAGDMVYDLDTFLRLRNEIGPTIAANMDPSHLFFMGIDPVEMIYALGDAIAYATVKDVTFRSPRVALTGVLSSHHYADWDARPWHYCALGRGHPPSFWAKFVMALREVGYDDSVAIEIEDPYLSREDAVRVSAAVLRQSMPLDPRPVGNWFDSYEWNAPDVQ